MSKELVLLLGNEHLEPSKFEVKQISPDIVLGISSVVDKSSKTHNLVNNEDACGVYKDSDVLISMVADSHSGYVASHEAVKRFPSMLKQKLSSRPKSPKDVMQAYLDTILDLYVNMYDIGGKSGIIYEREDVHPIGDMSSTTFHSVIKVGTNYYAIGCGDSFTAITKQGRMTVIKPVCKPFLCYVDLRQKIKEEYFDYNNKMVQISDAYQKRLQDTTSADEQTKLLEEKRVAMSQVTKKLEAMLEPPMEWDRDYVRRIIPVHQLDVKTGDTIFLCTDGIGLEDKGYGGSIAPAKYIGEVLSNKPLPEAVQQIFQGVQKREFQIDYDNVAIVAVNVK